MCAVCYNPPCKTRNLPAQILVKQRANLTNQITDKSLETMLRLKFKCFENTVRLRKWNPTFSQGSSRTTMLTQSTTTKNLERD